MEIEIILLGFLALVVCAIFGTSFLAAIADFAFSFFMKVFNFGFALSGCLIRCAALVVGFFLLVWIAQSCQG